MKEPIQRITTDTWKIVVARIDPGEDLLKSIEVLAEREEISAGVILSVVGSLRKARFRNLKVFPSKFPISETDRLYRLVEGPLEILNVSGNICRRTDNEIHVHAHITASKVINEEILILGGHLVEGNETYVMVEVVIAALPQGSFTRKVHPERKSWEIAFR